MTRVSLIQAPVDTDRYYLPEEIDCWRKLHLLRYQLQFRSFLTPETFMALENVKFQHYGLLSLAASLLEAGYEVDYQASECYEAINFRSLMASDVIGISCITATYPNALRMADQLRDSGSRAVILLGGAHAQTQYETILSSTNGTFDYVMRGFAEQRLIQLLQRVLNGDRQLNDLPGLAYKHAGELVITADPEAVALDEIPLPAVHLTPTQLPGARVHTSFGCPYRCAFCNLHGATGRHYKSIDRLREELITLKEQKGAKLIYIGDPVFGHNIERALQTSQVMQELGLYWQCQTKVNLIKPQLVEIFGRDPYFSGVELGVETMDAELLGSISKKITPAQVQAAIDALRNAGVSVLTYWMFGLPGMTIDIARKDFDAMCALIEQGVLVHLNWMTPYPGSDFFHKPEAWGVKLVSRNWREYYSGGAPVYSLLQPRLSEQQMTDLYCAGVRQITRTVEGQLDPSLLTCFDGYPGPTVYRGLF